jgi:hypothetical protein
VRGNAENPEATEREQEDAHEGGREEHDAMSGHGHESPGTDEEQDEA